MTPLYSFSALCNGKTKLLLYAYRIPVRLIAVLQCGFTLVFATLVNWHVFVPLG